MSIENQMISGENYKKDNLPSDKYEDCIFHNCDLNASVLSKTQFIDCKFVDCDLSLANLNLTAFKDVLFENCKMLGLRFDQCSDFLFIAEFKNCQLDMSSFMGMKLANMQFENCSLKDVNFEATDLSESELTNCDLAQANFNNSKLFRTDFRTAYNYQIDPEFNHVRKAKFSNVGLAGLLIKYELDVE